MSEDEHYSIFCTHNNTQNSGPLLLVYPSSCHTLTLAQYVTQGQREH